jgi:type I site-specific restriction endonuclease
MPANNDNKTPEQRIDAAIDAVLKAAGWALDYYVDKPQKLRKMRNAMRKIRNPILKERMTRTRSWS